MRRLLRDPQLWALAIIAAVILGWVLGIHAEPMLRYSRAAWPHWQTVEVDGLRCSVRVHVLRRDALRKTRSPIPDVDTTDEDPCLILGGMWVDRYTGQVIGDPQGLDVDHLVPLGYAHRHGGAAWSRERKMAYANQLGYRWHLLAVSASENRRKGDQGPDTYVPPDRAFHCQYGEAWATVLIVEGLTPDGATRDAIRRLVATC